MNEQCDSIAFAFRLRPGGGSTLAQGQTQSTGGLLSPCRLTLGGRVEFLAGAAFRPQAQHYREIPQVLRGRVNE